MTNLLKKGKKGKLNMKKITGKKGKLNMITSDVANKYVVVRSFDSSLIVVLGSFFFWKI